MRAEWERIKDKAMQDVKLDISALDKACEDQSVLFLEYAELLADFIDKRDSLKQQLDEEKAMTDQAVRLNPKAYGIEKITENAVNAAVISDRNIQILEREVIEISSMVKRIEGVKRALEHKKDSIETLSQLYISGYFSVPNTNKQKDADAANVELRREQMKRKMQTSKRMLELKDHNNKIELPEE